MLHPILEARSLDDTLPVEFFTRGTLDVARDLLGTFLCRRLNDGTVLSAAIVETEAYTEDDPACHAFRGRTSRCEVMFGPGGFAYVYFIYGMYHCFNVVTEAENTAGAVLIRAVAADGGNGPGKLCRAWEIDRSINGTNLMEKDSPIWIARGTRLTDEDIAITPRIGLSVAVENLWRFTVKGHPSVSGPRMVAAVPRKKRNRSDVSESRQVREKRNVSSAVGKKFRTMKEK